MVWPWGWPGGFTNFRHRALSRNFGIQRFLAHMLGAVVLAHGKSSSVNIRLITATSEEHASTV